MMMNGGDGDAGGIEVQIGAKQLADGWKDRNAVCGSGIGSSSCIRLNRCYQADAQAGSFELTIDAKMIAAKCTGSGNSNAEDGFSRYRAASAFPSTAFRQRP
jgi:hypothetical protein